MPTLYAILLALALGWLWLWLRLIYLERRVEILAESVNSNPREKGEDDDVDPRAGHYTIRESPALVAGESPRAKDRAQDGPNHPGA
jgi:hypothetical protein